MKFTLLYFLTIVIFSCKTVQVINVANTNLKKDNYLVYENDSIKITYDLWYHHGLVSFVIYNKLDIPLYIDWKKEFLHC